MVGLKSFLLFAKAKVASVKSQPLARLELQAAFIGIRALRVVLHESRMSFTEVHAWTDSMTVKHWISHPPYRWKTFVANRVNEIQELSQHLSVTWHHWPGSQNPADITTRGTTAGLHDTFWKNGPRWLIQEQVGLWSARFTQRRRRKNWRSNRLSLRLKKRNGGLAFRNGQR